MFFGSSDKKDDEPSQENEKVLLSAEETTDDGTKSVELKHTNKIFLWSMCAAINSCNLGYNIGVNTVTSTLLQDYFDLTDIELEIFLGSLNILAMVGALSATAVTDRFGRRNAFTASSLIFVVGIALQTLAPNYATLLSGRVLIGLGVGFGLAVRSSHTLVCL
mmetsp:Transcript_32199/g.45795  ORF Transcript_32199/g.45795 Transcript_32199/m.45795 type:complete len:163 (+) Transcript_32199:137-625(+)